MIVPWKVTLKVTGGDDTLSEIEKPLIRLTKISSDKKDSHEGFSQKNVPLLLLPFFAISGRVSDMLLCHWVKSQISLCPITFGPFFVLNLGPMSESVDLQLVEK